MPRMVSRYPAVRGLYVALGIALLPACGGGGGTPTLHIAGPTMGTHYNVKIVDRTGRLDAKTIKAGIESILNLVDEQMSTYRDDSELSRLNANPSTNWIETSLDLVDVVDAAKRISRLTDGAFDVTVGPLVNLWGFGPHVRRESPPSADEIRGALSRVGYGKVAVRRSPPGIRKSKADIVIDLSAIAKGYAVDKISDHLASLGLSDYLVEIGGDLRASGRNIHGAPWAIAIEKPAPGGREVQRVVSITDQAVATSGDYRNYFETRGQRYSHTINPLTGFPVSHGLASVTVWSTSATEADAIATALMALGPEAGYTLARRQKLAAYFVARTETGFTAKSTIDLGPD